jgi:hypothetical protein
MDMKDYVRFVEEIQHTDVLTDFVGVAYGGRLAILVRTGFGRWQWIGCAAGVDYFDDRTYVSITEAVTDITQDECDTILVRVYVFDTKKEQFEWALNHM